MSSAQKRKLVLAIASILVIPAMVVGIISSKSNAAPAIDRVIAVGGSGYLNIADGDHRLVGPGRTVEMGVVDADTLIVNFVDGATFTGDKLAHFHERPLTVMAIVQERADGTKRCKRLTFLTGIHVIQ
jgi:hypothetical protein